MSLPSSGSGDLLVILRHPPHGSSWLREGLDVSLVSAVFAQAASLLFQGEVVLALLKGQQAGPLVQKGPAATLDMLAMYDIESLYIDAEALNRFGLHADALQLSAIRVDAEAIKSLLNQHQQVLTF